MFVTSFSGASKGTKFNELILSTDSWELASASMEAYWAGMFGYDILNLTNDRNMWRVKR